MNKIKYVTRSIYTIIVFLTITFFSSLGISTFQSFLTDRITNGNYSSNTETRFNLVGIQNLSKEELIKCIKLTRDIYIEKNKLEPGSYLGKAIYFNEKQKDIPHMVSGEYFKEENFISDEPVAVVGKDVLKYSAIEKNGERYFEYENIQYKIIGVMGYENRSSISDLEFIINLNAYVLNPNSVISESNYLIDSKSDINIFESFIKGINNLGLEINYEIMPNDNNKLDFNYFLENSSYIIIIFILMIFLVFINVFNITLQWIERKKKQIGIKKALGGTNAKIAFEIILEYQFLALISFVLGIVLYIVVIKSKVISIFNADIYLIATLMTYIFSSIIALMVSLLAIIKSLKIAPSIIMRGGKI